MTNEAIEKRRKYQREYRERNKEKLLKANKEWREKNKDKVRQYNIDYWERKAKQFKENEKENNYVDKNL